MGSRQQSRDDFTAEQLMFTLQLACSLACVPKGPEVVNLNITAPHEHSSQVSLNDNLAKEAEIVS